jgi:hypothetical protein
MRDFETGLTLERLKEALQYEPDRGLWFWKIKCCHHISIGDQAGTISNFYIKIRVDGFTYFAHRLAHFYMTGAWPIDQVDHEDLNKSNNRWLNIRSATRSQNNANRPMQKNNKSGVKGVVKVGEGKFVAKIRIDRKTKNLGQFPTLELAGAAYERAAKEKFGEFARAA